MGDGVKTGPIVGATTPLKLQDVLIGGDLATWGGGKVADWFLDRQDLVSEMSPDLAREQALKQVSAARNIGTAVHDEIAALLKGEERPPASPDVAPYLWSWTKFLAAEKPVFLFVEQRIVHPKHLYAGTFDFIARFPKRGNRVGLGDVKTGRWKESQALQLAAYSMGKMASEDDLTIDRYHRYWAEEDAVLIDLPRIRDYYILLLSPTGYELRQVDVTAADRRHYLRLVAAYHQIRAWENPDGN
jgi:hypothetical protein